MFSSRKSWAWEKLERQSASARNMTIRQSGISEAMLRE